MRPRIKLNKVFVSLPVLWPVLHLSPPPPLVSSVVFGSTLPRHHSSSSAYVCLQCYFFVVCLLTMFSG